MSKQKSVRITQIYDVKKRFHKNNFEHQKIIQEKYMKCLSQTKFPQLPKCIVKINETMQL